MASIRRYLKKLLRCQPITCNQNKEVMFLCLFILGRYGSKSMTSLYEPSYNYYKDESFLKKRAILKRDALSQEETETLLKDCSREPQENGEGLYLDSLRPSMPIEFFLPSPTSPAKSLERAILPKSAHAKSPKFKKTARLLKMPIKLMGLQNHKGNKPPVSKAKPNDQKTSTSPGELKSMKELDNQDQQLQGTDRSPNLKDISQRQHAKHPKLQMQKSNDSNITADIEDILDHSFELEKSLSETSAFSPELEKDNFLNTMTSPHGEPKIAYIDETGSIDGLG